jgi:hypothetical protein
MKTFKTLVAEVAQPKPEDEKAFKAKHIINKNNYPVDVEVQFTGGKIKKTPKRRADYTPDEAEDVYEARGMFQKIRPGDTVAYKGVDKTGKKAAVKAKVLQKNKGGELHVQHSDGSKGHIYTTDILQHMTEELDPVNKKAALGRFKDREDKDINNDGKIDGTDRYLHNRRKAVTKAVHKIREARESLEEKAKSEAQQMAAAVALAVKRGEKPKSALQGASKEMYKMSERDLEDFAKTKHKGIPYKVEESALEESEVSMMVRKLHFIAYAAEEIMDFLEMVDDPEEWFQNKLVQAFTMMQGLHSYIEGEKRMMQSMDYDTWGEAALGESITKMSNARLKFHATKDFPHGSYTKKEIKDEHRRRQKTEPNYHAVKPSLNEAADMAAIGRKLQKMAPKEKNDMISNAMAKLGDHLETFGTTFGPRNMKDLEKKTGLTANAIQMLLKRAMNESLDEVTQTAMKKTITYTDPKGHSRTRNVPVKRIDRDMHGQEKIRTEDLDEAYKPGSIRLRDGSSITLTKENADLLNQMLRDLTPNNRKSMEKVLMADKSGFNEIVSFAREAL